MPFGERILVKRRKIETKIIMTTDIKNEGEIIAVGEDRKDVPMRLKVGQIVLFSGYGMTQVVIDEDKENSYYLMGQNDVLAIIE